MNIAHTDGKILDTFHKYPFFHTPPKRKICWTSVMAYALVTDDDPLLYNACSSLKIVMFHVQVANCNT